MIMRFSNRVFYVLAVLLFANFTSLLAQSNTPADKIIARVDNYIVLLSDMEQAYQSMVVDKGDPGPNARCEILEGLLINKIMMAKAEIDSIIVDEVMVEGELERRMQYFISQAGGVDKLVVAFGKTIPQLKDDLREQVKEQLTTRKVQQEITSGVTVTPAEVKKYFNNIPKDSIPLLPAEIQVGQIIRYPEVSDSEKKKAKEKLIAIQQRIANGEDFAELAKEFSQDPGSKRNGGELGWTNRGEFAPEFEESALTMDIGEYSEPIETDFGFHLIHLLDRKGNKFRTRHILIRPESNEMDLSSAEQFLDSIRSIIIAGSVRFTNMAKEHTDDTNTKGAGGMFADPSTGDYWVSTDGLDPVIFFTTDTMKIGNITKPMRFRTEDGEPASRIIYYKNYREPHYANLKQDYQKLYGATLGGKKNDVLRQWLSKAKKEVFIDIDPEYDKCNILNEL
jgi:peptidyl-prolyl cis-trans isomerase SurA